MKLIGSYSCPFVRKISVILLEKNLPFTLVHAVDNTLSSAINPLGSAPVLIDAQGESHSHPSLIAEYLEWLQPEPALLPADARDALRVKEWAALADGVTSAALALVSECRRSADAQQEQRLWQHRARLRSGLDALEQGAAEGRWLNASLLSVADVAVACMLGFINVRRLMPNWCVDHPALVAMADRLFSRESFARTLPPATAGLYSDETIAARV
ncbi:Glutathione S-transferase family protein [Sodalis praecaptivus]|uniref:Glutathione S-transferase family protein n=1 Tax=Sodalis praecaptivus TaxID=1239307 RepID=W0HRQ0_9GAMM|nr:glutathione S-transferase [Sodalis praecaptivus]AHF75222.1 Glutathione S-transferase family protein [Sodalis praecaptivus]